VQSILLHELEQYIFIRVPSIQEFRMLGRRKVVYMAWRHFISFLYFSFSNRY